MMRGRLGIWVAFVVMMCSFPPVVAANAFEFLRELVQVRSVFALQLWRAVIHSFIHTSIVVLVVESVGDYSHYFGVADDGSTIPSLFLRPAFCQKKTFRLPPVTVSFRHRDLTLP